MNLLNFRQPKASCRLSKDSKIMNLFFCLIFINTIHVPSIFQLTTSPILSFIKKKKKKKKDSIPYMLSNRNCKLGKYIRIPATKPFKAGN